MAPGPEPAAAGERVPAWVVALGALAALALGALVVRAPHALELEVAPTLSGVAGVLLAGLLALLAMRSRPLSLVLLTGFVVLNLSQVLVRFHDLPSFLRLLALPVVFASLTAIAPGGLRRRLETPLTLALAGYCLLLLLSSTWADDSALADERFGESLKGLLIYLLVVGLVRQRKDLGVTLATLVAASSVLSLLAHYQAWTGTFDQELGGFARVKLAQVYGQVFEPRIAGPIGDPNFFAQSLLLAVAPGAALALNAAAAGGRGRAVLVLAATLAIAAAIVLTYSRGAALALGLVVVLVLAANRIGSASSYALGLLGLAVLLLALPAAYTRRLTTIAEVVPGAEETIHPDSSIERRRLFVHAAWLAFLDHPLLGVGAGNYSGHFERYADEVGSAGREYTDPDERHFPHNLYLEAAAENGVIGLIGLGAVLAAATAALARAGRAFAARGDEKLLRLSRAVAISLSSYLVTGLFLHGAFQRPVYLLLGLATAFVVLAGQAGPATPDPKPPAAGGP